MYMFRKKTHKTDELLNHLAYGCEQFIQCLHPASLTCEEEAGGTGLVESVKGKN